MRTVSLALMLFFCCNYAIYAQKINPINYEEVFSTGEEDHTPLSPHAESNSGSTDVKGSAIQTQDIISYNQAQIIALNKITAKSKTLTINIQESEYFGNIEITVHRCIKKTDPYKPNNLALLSITEHKTDDDPKLLFQGWMFSSSIALSNFEHPIYEIFIKNCL